MACGLFCADLDDGEHVRERQRVEPAIFNESRQRARLRRAERCKDHLEIAAFFLFSFNRFEEGFEVADPEAL